MLFRSFSHDRLTAEQLMDFIKDNESFLMETKQQFGRTNMDDFFNEYLKQKKKNVPDHLMMPDILKNTDDNENIEVNKNIKSQNELLNMLPMGFSMIAFNPKLVSQLNINFNQNIENIVKNQIISTNKEQNNISPKKEKQHKENDLKINPFQSPNSISNSEINKILFGEM